MNEYFPELFRPGYIGNLWLRNRIVMAPMATHFAHINGEVSDTLIAHYATRARGGVGLIIVEAACVTSMAANESFGQLYISNPRYVLGLNRLSEAIRANGSRAFIQLFHAGRQTSRLMCGGEQPVAPSAIPCSMMKEMPRELTTLEVKQIINEFIAAAHYAHRAGFDGVELHAAHGYLINQFLSPHTNHRTDEYGGSLQNRQRFLMEIITEIKEILPELTISVRLNIDDFIQGGLGLGESLEVCKCLEKSGVDIINCSCGTYESGLKSIEPASYEEGWRVYLAETVKKVVAIPVMSGGMIRNPDFANQVLADKKADFIFLGRSILADPEWVNKVRKNEVAHIRPCISCNNCIASGFKGLEIRCAVNPFCGRETMLNQENMVPKQARVVIVGGGPAGMQAAVSLRRRGLSVTLYEKAAELGGFMSLAAVPSHKEQVLALRNYMVKELLGLEVEVVLNHEFTRDDLRAIRPDVLVIATGSKAVRPPIAGSDQSNCVEAIEVLDRKVAISGQKVAVIGGGSTGCEVADYLAAGGNQVTILEAGPFLAADMERKNRRALMTSLDEAGVEKRTGILVTEVMGDSLRIDAAGVEEILPVDWVVWATGFKPQDELFKTVQEDVPFIFIVGDSVKVRGFKEAIMEGEMLGDTIARLVD